MGLRRGMRRFLLFPQAQDTTRQAGGPHSDRSQIPEEAHSLSPCRMIGVRRRIDDMEGGAMHRVILISIVGMLMVPHLLAARAQVGPAFASKVLVDNDRVRVQRLAVPAGFREPM